MEIQLSDLPRSGAIPAGFFPIQITLTATSASHMINQLDTSVGPATSRYTWQGLRANQRFLKSAADEISIT
jgi:hypothetical protein